MKNEKMEIHKTKKKGRNIFGIILILFGILICLSLINFVSAYDWDFSNPNDYIYNSSEIIVSGGNAYLNGTVVPIHAWWHLNELSGTDVYDSSGNERNGTTVNSPAWVNGKLNNSLNFSGIQYVDLGYIADFDRYDAFSVDGWINISDVTGTIIGKRQNTGSYVGWDIMYSANKIYFYFANATTSNMISVYANVVVADGNWHHFAVTYDGSSNANGVKIYIDGVSQGLTIQYNSLTGSAKNSIKCYLASRNGGNNYRGMLDEIAIYNGVLNQDSISFRYNGGLGTEKGVPSFKSGYNSIQPKNNFSFFSKLMDFNEIAIKTGGEIKYSVSINGTWRYWNGSSWVNSNKNWSQSNNASDIKANIGTLGNSGNFIFNALLFSNDGTETPYLDNVEVFAIYQNITFVSKIPADLSVNLSSVNITYNIFNGTNPLNLSSIKLFYKVNSSILNNDCWSFINGTCSRDGYISKSYLNNISSDFNWFLDDDDIYPAIYSLDRYVFRNIVHNANTFFNPSEFIKMKFFNVSNTSQYNILNFMINNSVAGSNLMIYYCNSSYISGKPSLSTDCNNFYNLASPSFFNEIEGNSSYIDVSMAISSGMVGNIVVTPVSYFVFGISNTPSWNYYTIPNISRIDTFQTSINNGITWSDFSGTLDMHFHQYNVNATFFYFASACDIFGYCVNSSQRKDLFLLGNQPPSAPRIISPITNFYHDIFLINYTKSISPNNYSVNFYNITLLNTDFTYNRTITENNSNNLGYIYNSSLSDDGFFVIRVIACDINNLCSSGFSQYFLIDNTYPYGDLIDPTNNSFYSNPTVNFTINASDNVALGNLTLNIRYPNGTLIYQETITTNETSGIFGIVYTFLVNGIFEWFYTIYDVAGNFFQTVVNILTIISIPSVSISYPINDSVYDYTIIQLDYSVFNADNCWYSLDDGMTNISSGCGSNQQVNGLISNNGINIWNVYANNSIGNETSAQVIFNSTCSSPIPILTLVSYPYVDLNISYPIKVSPFYIGVSNIKLQMTEPNGSVSIYNMIYDNISSYVLTFNFDTIGNYNFIIYGDNICPTIVVNITGTLLVRQPYYVTICGFNDKTGTSYKNEFAVLTAEYTNSKYNADLDQFITPLGFATTFKTPVFHTPYVNGCGTLKLYEPNQTYILRLFDGITTFDSEYSAPNMTKSYGTNIAIGQNTFNGTSENLSVYLSAKDINPWFWAFNWILIILIGAVVIISIFLFFIISERPTFALIFFIMGILGLLILRVVIYFWIG